jgi:pimeloyl-ACP methyl ester carboxylesterase
LAAIVGHAALHRLKQIRAPTLVITGDADRLVPPRNSEVLAAAIPDARLLVLPGAGHVFPLEREEETVRALTEHFLGARRSSVA